MKHVLIITGGHINISFAKQYIKTLSFDKVFAVDKGLEYVDELELAPDYIIGDFDTVDNNVLSQYEDSINNGIINACIMRYPVKKDASDTELAIEYAKKEHADKITLMGATGSRLDHVLANLSLLRLMSEAAIDCIIVDETNRIRLIDTAYGNGEFLLMRQEQFGNYVSLIPLSEKLEHVTLEGVMYPLVDNTVMQGSSLTISNQITEKTARIHIGSGAALLIESRDSWK